MVGHLLVFIQGLLLTPVVIKVSGPETYGAYILLMSYIGLMFGISSLGVGISAKRWLPGVEDLSDRARLFYPQFWFQTISVTLLGCATALAFTSINISIPWNFAGFSLWLLPVYLLTYVVYSQATEYFR